MSLSASVCLFAGLRKNYSNDFHEIRWKGGRWARENQLDFGHNPDHVIYERVRVMIRCVHRHTPHGKVCV